MTLPSGARHERNEMEIEDAFTSEAIERFETNIDDETERLLRGLITTIYSSNQLPLPSDDALNVAVLCFLAGRTFQSDLDLDAVPLIEIPMTADEVHEYIAYLAKKGAS
jgi:cytochrome P450